MAAMGQLRRPVLVAAGIGACAGSMGTYFEMSHGVVCIPVLTLPPLALTNQVAVGSTVFGVAARELLSVGLYCLDPEVELGSDVWKDQIHELIDVRACLGLASAGTLSAIAGASLAARGTNRFVRRTNGVFCLGLALFIQWRESQRSAAREELEAEASVSTVEARPDPISPALSPPERAYQQAYGQDSSVREMCRFAVLGAASGFILGYFGIGAAWFLAPVLRHTSESGTERSKEAAFEFGADDRTRHTAALSMAVPSVAAAVRHYQLGHVASVGGVALPLAVGAIAGSAIGGKLLEDVPREGEEKLALAIMLFAFGTWSFFKP